MGWYYIMPSPKPKLNSVTKDEDKVLKLRLYSSAATITDVKLQPIAIPANQFISKLIVVHCLFPCFNIVLVCYLPLLPGYLLHNKLWAIAFKFSSGFSTAHSILVPPTSTPHTFIVCTLFMVTIIDYVLF